MENTEINSCLMWAVNLITPVDLSSVFDEDDLKDTGIELDSHITLLYAQGKTIDRHNLLEDINTILGENYESFIEVCKSSKEMDLLDLFELGSFENDSDYVVLKLKKDSEIFKYLNLINKGLRTKYEVSSDFDNYTPHLTLAELNPGTASKYLNSETLKLILTDSTFKFEDLMISYGTSNEVVDRKQYFLTSFSCVDRYFRIENLKRIGKDL